MPFPGKRQRLFAIQPVDALRHPHCLMSTFIGGILNRRISFGILNDHARWSEQPDDAWKLLFKVEVHIDVQQLFHRIDDVAAARTRELLILSDF